MNFYKHHLGDYDGATAHLTWDEDMAYTRLLRAYYRTERPIPCDQAYRLSRASSKAQKAAVDSVLREFFQQQGDYWHNKRADEEIEAYQAQCAHNRVAGNLGGRPKKTKVVSENNHSGSENKPNDNPNQIPDTRTSTPEPETSRSTPLARGDKSPSLADPVNGNEVAFIPLVGDAEFGVSPELLAELETAYPQVDGLATLKQIRAWCITNPTQRKTRRGVARFINRWFEKDQNHG